MWCISYMILPDKRLSVCREGQAGDGTVMALKQGDAFAGLQVPEADLVVHGGGKELQLRDVRMELDKAEEKEHIGGM